MTARVGRRGARPPVRPRPRRGPGRPRPVPRARRPDRRPGARARRRVGPAGGAARGRRASTSPASTSTRRCSPGRAPRPTTAGVDGRPPRAPRARATRATVRLAGRRRVPAGDHPAQLDLPDGHARATRRPPSRRWRPTSPPAGSPSSTRGCPTPTTSPATTAASCSSGSARSPDTGPHRDQDRQRGLRPGRGRRSA